MGIASVHSGQLRAAARTDKPAPTHVIRVLREGDPVAVAPAAADLKPREAIQLSLRLRPSAAHVFFRLRPDAPSLRVVSALDSTIGEGLLDAETQDRLARVAADADREYALKLATVQPLPIVDKAGRLVGQITDEELRAIERAEADEDGKLLAGIDPTATPMDGPLRIVPRRLPWLAVGLVGAGTAAAILASLIPIVMSLAGNAGIQAATVTVQAQTANSFWIGDLGGRILREVRGALLNGALVGLLVAGVVVLIGPLAEIERAPALGLTAALTLTMVTLQAATIGSLVPVALDRLGFDPAVATGVFITTSNDVVGVLIFFSNRDRYLSLNFSKYRCFVDFHRYNS